MEGLQIGASICFVIGFFLLIYIIGQSEDCTFSVERVNLICETGNVSEKALFVIVSSFFFVLGYILFKKHQQSQYMDSY
jgi:hypothetical protein